MSEPKERVSKRRVNHEIRALLKEHLEWYDGDLSIARESDIIARTRKLLASTVGV